MPSRLFALAAAACLLSSCGGAHTGILPTSSDKNPAAGVRATLSVRVPAKAKNSNARRPLYISPSTQSISLSYSIGSKSYPAQALNVTPGSPGCTTDTSGNTNCTLTFGATAGEAAYTVSAFDGANGTGNLLASAQSSTTIVAGRDNSFNVTLDGVPQYVSVSFTGTNVYSEIPAGTAADIGVRLSAYDADYGLIVNSPSWWSQSGSAYTTGTLTMAPDNGEITLSQNGTPISRGAAGYQITAPFTGITAHYNGGLYTDVSLTAGVGNLSARSTLSIDPVLTEYTLPDPNSDIWGMAQGPDGNVWFTDQQISRIGKITPDGTITEYPLQDPAKFYYPEGIASGPDGNLWVAEWGNLCACLVRINTNAVITGTYPAYHNGCEPYPAAVAVDGSNNVWYSDSACSNFGYVNATSGAFTAYQSIAQGDIIAGAPDGNIWFNASGGSHKIGRITPAGTVTYYPLTTDVKSIATGADHNLWVAETYDSNIARIDPSTGATTEFPVNSFAGQIGPLALGADGNVWFAHGGGWSTIAPDGTTKDVSTYDGAYRQDANPRAMVQGADGSLWFSEAGSNGGAVIGKLNIGKAAP